MSKLHFVVIALFLVTTACIVESAEKVYPHKAQVIGTDVYIRSGSASQFYFTGKLNEPQQVIVVEQRLGWSKIVPPKGSFSWVAKEFIQIDSDKPGNAIVTGNGLRVWAGRADIRPEDSTSQQTTLNKNDVVKLIGEEVGDYYKIKSPDNAYLWVKSDYLKDIGPVSLPTFKPTKKPVVKETVKPLPKEVKPIEPAKKTVEIVKEKPAPSVVTREPIIVKQSPEEIASLKNLYKLVEDVNLEKKKPADKQNFTKIKASLKSILENDKVAKAKKYAQYQLDEIDGYELARDVNSQMKTQDSELAEIRKKLHDLRKQKSAVILKEKTYALVGKLKKSQVYDDRAGQARYLVVDDNGKITCYAVPVKTAAGMNIAEYIGKRVGLKGKFVPDTKTGISLLKFEDMQLLEK